MSVTNFTRSNFSALRSALFTQHRDNSKKSSFEELPPELLTEILGHLSPFERITAARVCRTLNKASNSSCLMLVPPELRLSAESGRSELKKCLDTNRRVSKSKNVFRSAIKTMDGYLPFPTLPAIPYVQKMYINLAIVRRLAKEPDSADSMKGTYHDSTRFIHRANPRSAPNSVELQEQFIYARDKIVSEWESAYKARRQFERNRLPENNRDNSTSMSVSQARGVAQIRNFIISAAEYFVASARYLADALAGFVTAAFRAAGLYTGILRPPG